MKKQQEEMKVELIEELDLSRVPQDIFDVFLNASEEAIEEISVKQTANNSAIPDIRIRYKSR